MEQSDEVEKEITARMEFEIAKKMLEKIGKWSIIAKNGEIIILPLQSTVEIITQ